MRPLGRRVFISKIALSDTTESGVVMPESMKTKNANRGTITAIGDEVTKVKVGEVVLFNANYADETGEENILIIDEQDLWAVIPN